MRLNGHSAEMADFEPPQSTMAAQLINNLSTATKPSRQRDHDELKLLMAEVSDTENSGAEFENDEARLEHREKLLYLLTRTVLEKLTSDDPFMDITKLVMQASDALDVFITIIKESPAVLAHSLGRSTILQNRGHEPLWLWLFPRVLALLGRKNCDGIIEKIKEFFYVAFQTVARSPRLWNLTSLFFGYMKECAATILSRLQHPSIVSQYHVLKISLPSDDFDTSYFSYENYYDKDENQTTSSFHCTYVIHGAASSLWHVTNLLAILGDISMESASSYDATAAFQDYLAWMLESFLMAHEVGKRLKVDTALQDTCKKCELTIFCSMQALISSLRSHLSGSVLRKGCVLISLLCADLLANPESLTETIQLKFCSTMLNLVAVCREFDSMCQVLCLHLIPALQLALNHENASTSFGKDFQKAAVSLCTTCGAEVRQGVDLISVESFDSVELDGEFQRLELESQTDHHRLPPNKRRKINSELGLLEQITERLYSLLGSQESTELTGLAKVTEACFAELNDNDRCKAIEYLAMIPCAAVGSLEATRDHDGTIRYSKCLACEEGNHVDPTGVHKDKYQSVCNDAILSLSALVQSQTFQESRRPRVLAMFALKAFTTHFKDAGFIDFKVSNLGQWCLKSLQSSIRELRIAAGRTLPGFLHGSGISQDLMMHNRVAAFALLRTISEQDTIHLQESCILAWGQIGRTLNDDELHLVIHRLVLYLGHTNPIISGVAFNEILTLAKTSEKTVERMFSPFWDTIAIVAVKQLLSKPQMVQSMVDLLGMKVTEFLVLTQPYTLPYLVAYGKVDVIGRIAHVIKNDEKWAICMERSNLLPILAFLLVQDVEDMETFIMSSLRATSSSFKDSDITELMRAEPATIALILLKSFGDADESKRSRIRLALDKLAQWAPPNDNVSRKVMLGAFLGQHILGLVDKVSKVVYDANAGESVSEKKRCVKAIEEMVILGKTFTRTARPQMCACLQSALAQPELQELAFSAWEKMLHHLEDEDVELMLESTFSTVIQRWESFNETTQNRAESALQYLLKHRTRLIRNTIVNLPSLSEYPTLSKVEEQLQKLRSPTDVGNAFQIFSRRIRHENSEVVTQALVELKAYLKVHQSFLQSSTVSEQPDVVIGLLVRSILDSCVKFSSTYHEIAQLSAECIGLIGCIDPNRVEAVRDQRDMVVVSNFHDPGETTDFILFILENVIVQTFLSSTDTGVQGFLSYVMQDLLEKCDFTTRCVPILQSGDRNSTDDIYLKWKGLPPSVQDTLTPFLTSRYSVIEVSERIKVEYPIFRPDTTRPDKLYNNWLKPFVLDLLHKPLNPNADLIFASLQRAIRIRDNTVASFLLPYVVLHVIVEGTDQNRTEIGQELLKVLQYEIKPDSNVRRDELKTCSEAVFRVLDYLSRWIQVKQSQASKRLRDATLEAEHREKIESEIRRVKAVLEMLPAEIISQRAVECKSYSRALFYWEQHIRQVRETVKDTSVTNVLLERLQDIYTQIDEPDGIEGISAHLHVLDIDQQVLGHRKAGRWTAAQSWYEIKLAEDPDNVDVQLNLLTCLKESGQHDVLLNYVEGMHTEARTLPKLLPFATEASWATGRWATLEKFTSFATKDIGEDFNVTIGNALLALHKNNASLFTSIIQSTRKQIACSMSTATSYSIGACHDTMLKFHVLTELEMIAGTENEEIDRAGLLESLNRRLEVIGAYLNDKQYLLGIRRASMQLSSVEFTKGDIASAWLTSARLARKGNALHQSFNAVLHASQLGDESATIEHARLLWKEGHHRKAIQNLQGAIANNAFISHNKSTHASFAATTGIDLTEQQNLLTARAHLLLAKWLDSAGQTQSNALRSQYQLAAKTHMTWEKGHYYLGRHYNKLLESEKTLGFEHQSDQYITGDMAKLVIENYLRALSFGTKYIYQALPRLLTLWLDLGIQVNQPIEAKYGTKDFITRILNDRKQSLAQMHSRFNKYIAKLPAYIFYTAFPQIIARIAHPNPEVYKFLQDIIYKIVATYPQQAIWSLLAVSTSIQSDRKNRGISILQRLRNGSKKADTGSLDLRGLIKNGERLTSDLLLVCSAGEFHGNKTTTASLSKDLHFNSKAVTPSALAVPVESVLTATLPTLTDNMRDHRAFSRDVVTISSFLDEVLVLSSLQKPRKLTARGSDGKLYGLMCKPKDDLRKDQRLMEFNSMINRSLKRDAESSRRQLYIKTYAVTPLNEECGLIEWVEGLKTLRDILLQLYKPLGIFPNYREIELYCEEASKGGQKLALFTNRVLAGFPPIFHTWFVQQFPEPSAWFAARLRYTRSCAVMSMVGTILGLGDRHGENILFEEGNGGTFHVDFNCLFDKGLTFVKPERVPFRLTHNMVDAMGIYGYEGPFRRSSELTLKLLRQHEDSLMTILEAFVHDPTLDLLAKKPEKKKKQGSFVVPETAQGVLDSIRRKVRGLLTGESVPLSVEGQVDELIKQATNLQFLAGMYIGWCSFF
ncbi:protein kinase-like protein rad3 [Bisporella sp. PMI_857]|nr:protein kinase-like protein rad3 [Bisporella sp. PMI_857]